MGGKVQVYRRENSRHWQCSTYLNGRNHRKSTKEDSLAHAKQIAEDWYLELRGKSRAGLLKKSEQSFRQAAQRFLNEYEIITAGERSPLWVKGHEIRLRLHLLPFFGDMGVSEIMAGKWQDYHVHRIETSKLAKPKAASSTHDDTEPPKPGKPPARSTMHDELVTLRLVLKSAVRHKALDRLPDLSQPYKARTKIVHRPWFSPEEYKQLYKASSDYARTCPARHRWNAEQVHDFILFLANTGLRPDEAKERNLQHRDIKIVLDKPTNERILEIEVRGKRGVGYCKSMPGAVLPYTRLRNRLRPLTSEELKLVRAGEPRPSDEDRKPKLTDPVFPGNHIKLFNGILRRVKLKLDRDSKPRTAYSLRHTYICMRLMEGADIYQVAKNCRTSVDMIEEHYAKHLKDTLDTRTINVRRGKSSTTPIKTSRSRNKAKKSPGRALDTH